MIGSGIKISSNSERLTFPRSRHLKRKRFIDPLFDRRDSTTRSVRSGSIRIVYRVLEQGSIDTPFQIGVAVGKSRGNAVRRNRIKRTIWESVRLNQHVLKDAVLESELTAMILFQGSTQTGAVISADTIQAMVKLQERLNPDLIPNAPRPNPIAS